MKVGIVGATGYVGSELARWILGHPDLALVAAVSGSRAGEPLGSAVPALLGLTDLVLAPLHPRSLRGLDAVFLALPHGAAGGLVAELGDVPRIVDLSADHRHAPGWVYGAPELARETLAGATRIAAPGCFATALQLALGPLVAAGAVRGPVRAVAQTGSTGSGASPSAGTHHPERFANLSAYKVLAHQHVPEVRTLLASLGGTRPPELLFVPTSAPIDRGIFATVFVEVGEADAGAVLRDAYAGERLVRFRDRSPELRLVRGTAFADLAVHQEGPHAVVLVALDNLGKGAASQAVQCLNLAVGWPTHRGLHHPGATP